MIGDIQATLRANGAARDTYIVFGSDNGFHLGEHRLQSGKMTAFDTDIKVPLVVTGPGVVQGGTSGRLAQNTDLCPTFETLGGAEVPASVDGQSLVPELKGKTGQPPRDAVLIEHHGPDRDKKDPDFQVKASGNPTSYEAIRTRDGVYVEYADGEREYYDLKRDLYELTNTANRLTPAQSKKLRTTLHKLTTCSGGNCH